MKTNQLLALGGILLVILIALIGWMVASNKPTGTPTGEPFNIGVAVYPGFAPFALAEQKGFFADEGVNAKVVQITDNNQLVPALGSDEVQMLPCSVDCSALIADAGIDALQVFITDESLGADGIVTTTDVNDIADLKGKTVYLAQGFPAHFLLRVLAERAGLAPADITLKDMDPDQVGTSFVAGKINAGATWEPWLSKASERKDGKVLLTSADASGIIVDTVFVRADALVDQREDVKAVIRAYFKAVDYWKKNPAEANSIMGASMGMTGEEFAEQVALTRLADYKYNLEKFDRSKDGSVYELSKMASDIYLADGLISSPVNPENVIDATILRDLNK